MVKFHLSIQEEVKNLSFHIHMHVYIIHIHFPSIQLYAIQTFGSFIFVLIKSTFILYILLRFYFHVNFLNIFSCRFFHYLFYNIIFHFFYFLNIDLMELTSLGISLVWFSACSCCLTLRKSVRQSAVIRISNAYRPVTLLLLFTNVPLVT